MRNISISEVQPGMTLARTIINDSMIVVLAENTFLSVAHITRLKFLGIESLYIKDAYDLSPQNSIVQSMLSSSHAFVADYQEVLSVAEDIFAITGKSKSIPVKKAKDLVHHSIIPMVKKSGAIDYLYELKHLDNSTFNHSLRVSILAGVLAKWLQYSEDAIQDVILAGFLHDIGKMQLDKSIIEKNIENLTETEREIYIQHTLNGSHLLSADKTISEGVQRAALQHHENMDGSGFPFGSHNEDIHVYAKIVAVANIYDNITTEREGFLKQTPFSALEEITQKMFTSLDPKICIPFLLNVQQVFIGSKVLLSNKEKGAIIQYAKDFAALPLVQTDAGEIIDLNLRSDLKIVEYNPS